MISSLCKIASELVAVGKFRRQFSALTIISLLVVNAWSSAWSLAVKIALPYHLVLKLLFFSGTCKLTQFFTHAQKTDMFMLIQARHIIDTRCQFYSIIYIYIIWLSGFLVQSTLTLSTFLKSWPCHYMSGLAEPK